MRSGLDSDRGRARCRRAAALLASLAAVVVPSPHRAGTLAGSADAMYGRANIDGADSTTLEQNYTLRFHQPVYDPFTYRLSLNLSDSRGTQEGLPAGRSQRFQPIVGFDLKLDRASVQAQYEGIFESTGSLTSGVDYRQQRALGQLDTRPHKMLTAGLTGMRAIRSDDAGSFRITEDLASASLTLKPGPLQLQQSGTFRSDREDILRFSRRQYGSVTRIAYQQQIVQAVRVGAQYMLTYERAQEETTSGATVDAPRRVPPSAGLYAFDDLPLDGTLPALAALADGNVGVSAGVGLGPAPDGSSFQNVGVDMGRVVELDEIILYVRDGAARPVLSGGQIAWTVYTSVDGAVWQSVPTSSTFSTSASVYSIVFPPTEAQYFKVVNVGTNTLATYVTEIEVVVHESLSPTETRTRNFLSQNGQLSIGASPVSWFSTSYDLRVNAIATEDVRAPTARSSDRNQTLAVRGGPWHGATLGLSHSRLRVETDTAARSQVTSAANLAYSPIRGIATALTGSYTTEEFGPFWTRTSGLGASAALKPWALVRLQTGLGYSRQTRTEQPDPREYLTASMRVDTRVTQTLDVNANSSGQWSLDRAPTPASASPLPWLLVYHRHYVDTFYRPGAQLRLQARFGYVSAQTSGWIQNYRVGWDPFTGGTVTLSLGFDNDIDFVSGRRARREYASVGWQINRRAALDVGFSHQELRTDRVIGSQDSSQRQVFAGLRIVL